MPMDKRFIKATISQESGAYVVRITYSYYSLYNYEYSKIFSSSAEAKDFLLYERCNGSLKIDI